MPNITLTPKNVNYRLHYWSKTIYLEDDKINGTNITCNIPKIEITETLLDELYKRQENELMSEVKEGKKNTTIIGVASEKVNTIFINIYTILQTLNFPQLNSNVSLARSTKDDGTYDL